MYICIINIPSCETPLGGQHIPFAFVARYIKTGHTRLLAHVVEFVEKNKPKQAGGGHLAGK